MDIEKIEIITNGFVSKATFKEISQPETSFVIGDFNDSCFDPELYELLDVPRPVGFEKMATKRRSDFLAGRIFARLAFEQLGVPFKDIPVAEDRAPIWPSGIRGSISHSHGRACCLLTQQGRAACGVDIEKVAKDGALDAIIKRCLTPIDVHWIENQQDLPSDQLATLVFSAKETIFKAYYGTVGRFFGFECAEVQERAGGNAVSFRLTETLHPLLPKGYEIPVHFEIEQGYVLTWCQASLPE